MSIVHRIAAIVLIWIKPAPLPKPNCDDTEKAEQSDAARNQRAGERNYRKAFHSCRCWNSDSNGLNVVGNALNDEIIVYHTNAGRHLDRHTDRLLHRLGINDPP
jgi:hypothetical protein